MNTYQVILTRNVTESVVVEVEAEDETKAMDMADDKAGRYGNDVPGWELDSGNFAEVYVTGCDQITEKETA